MVVGEVDGEEGFDIPAHEAALREGLYRASAQSEVADPRPGLGQGSGILGELRVVVESEGRAVDAFVAVAGILETGDVVEGEIYRTHGVDG